MKLKNYKLFWLLALVLVFSCETTELDALVDPNVPTPDSLNEDGSLNFIQFNLSLFFAEATEAGAESVRLEYMFDEYDVNFNNTNVNIGGMWRIGYADILNEIQAITPIATNSGSHRHLGVARIIKAYTLMTLVDYFGDIPYSEALQGDVNPFPNVDPASDVYNAALAELDLALNDFSNIDGNTPAFNDLYYGEGNSNTMPKWTKLANTLKFKYYLNRRLIDQAGSTTGINALLTAGNIIDSSADDFRWQASTSVNPQSKHPYYVEEYDAANTGEYITNYLMWSLAEEKGTEDPRLRYYVYRQSSAFPTDPATLDNEISCWNDPRPASYAAIDAAIAPLELPFCSLFGRGDGYWGRDHANAEGIPPDNAKRATFGVYPVGGRFDDNDADGIDSGDGLNGAGIWPIMMDSFVYFMRAEAALYLGTADDAAAMLEQGIRSSMTTVTGFLPNPGDFTNTADATDIDDYVTAVMNSYTAATSDAERMNIIGKEYWLALFGNGVEGYNLYRRTGAPNNLQPTLLGTSSFPRSFLYPSNTVDRNPNISQKPGLTEQLFWDNNPAGFIQ